MPNPLPDQIKLYIDIIDFQLIRINFDDDKNCIHNDQIGLMMIKENFCSMNDEFIWLKYKII